jgi:nicotinate-nucleotide pyrophosphorylase
MTRTYLIIETSGNIRSFQNLKRLADAVVEKVSYSWLTKNKAEVRFKDADITVMVLPIER